jgi:hypothetical protein
MSGKSGGKSSKRKRTPKTSKGIHGATKHPLDEVSKVLLGKGMYRSFKPLGTKS